MPEGMSAPLAATMMVVLSPSMSSQMRCASASWRAPKPRALHLLQQPGDGAVAVNLHGPIGAVRYLVALGFR